MIAQNLAGYMFEHGEGTVQDKYQAFNWYKKSAEQGYASGQNNLALLYEKGEGTAQNFDLAFSWYKKSALQGEVIAQYNLALLYKNGKGTEQNWERTFYWLKKSAEKGEILAQYDLARAYYAGEGTESNMEQAFYWYKKCAEQNNMVAQLDLAAMYFNGEGTKQDFSMAFTWNKKSAEQGYAPAQNNLGYHYEHGKGVAMNKTQAFYWYKKGAEQNDSFSQYHLACLFANGEGTKKDEAQAAYWYKKSAEQGYEPAIDALKALTEKKEEYAVKEDTKTQQKKEKKSGGMNYKKAYETYLATSGYDLALKYINDGMQNDKEYADIPGEYHSLKSSILLQLDRFDESIKEADMSLNYDNTLCRSYYTKGTSYFFNDRHGDALSVFNEGLNYCGPDIETEWYFDILENRGRVNYMVNNYYDAVEDYTEIIKYNKKLSTNELSNIHLLRCFAFYELDQTLKARMDLNFALQLDPGNEDAKKALTLMNIADAAGLLNSLFNSGSGYGNSFQSDRQPVDWDKDGAPIYGPSIREGGFDPSGNRKN
ncbi:MAG: sel1 repeat family protein [Lewinellaceae bacterium]|nr:sel1 repeat family protein [Lewinellaceae bacterium]